MTPRRLGLGAIANVTVRPAVRRTAVSLLFRLGGLAIGVLTNALLAHSLGVSAFGQFGLGLTILTVISQLSDFGAVQAMTAEARRNPHAAGRVAGSGLMIRLVTAVVGVAVAIPLGLSSIPNANALVLVLIVACAPLGASGVLVALSNARMRPEVGSALALGQSGIWLVAVAFLAARGQTGAMPFAVAFAVTTIVQTGITLTVYGAKSMIGRPSWETSKLILQRSWPVGLLGVLVTSYYRVGGVLVIGLAGAHEAGLYTAAYKVIDVAQLVPSLIVVPMLPVLIDALRAEPERLQRLSSSVIRLSLLVAIGSGLMLAVFSRPIVKLIYGDEFARAAPVLELLGVAFIGITMGYVGSTICFALDRVKRQIPFVAGFGLVSLSLQPWAISQWGALGSAGVAAVTELVMCSVSLALCAGTLRLKLSEIFGWRFTIFSLVIILAYASTRGSFVSSIVVCGSCFALAAWALKLFGANEIDLILRRKA